MTLQRDSSSLKLLVSDNGLLCTTCCPGDLPDPNEQSATCQYCDGVQPIKVRVIISDLVDVDPSACTPMIHITREGKFPNGIAEIMNNTFIVPHVPGIPCRYNLNIPIDYTFEYWNVGCPIGPPDEVVVCDVAWLRVTQMTATNIAIQCTIKNTASGKGASVFFSTRAKTGGCFESSNQFDTDGSTGPCAETGTAILEI